MKNKLLLSFVLFIGILLLNAAGVSAAKSGYLYYKIENNEVTITSHDNTRWLIEIPDKIEGLPVTRIDNHAFYNSDITSLSIGKNVKFIGESAFSYCPISVLIIPDNVKSIGDSAFWECESLANITIGSGVTDIGGRVFYNCPITNISVSSKNKNYSSESGILYNKNKTTLIKYTSGSSNTSYTIPGGVKNIGESAFASCEKLSSISIPDSVEDIGDYAFECCDNISSITIPGSVKNIGESAFASCEKLSSINIAEGVTTIGDLAFSLCDNIKTITIPKSLTKIGDAAFCFCDNLAHVNIKDIAAWCNIEFADADSNPLYNGGTIYLNGNPVSALVFPGNVTKIGDYAFYNCLSITSVTIPYSVKSIGKYAFGECSNITGVNTTDISAWCNIDFANEYSNPLYYGKKLYVNGISESCIVIPDNTTKIGNYAFYGCTNITGIKISNGVKTIGAYAFYDCENLKEITLPDGITTIGSGAFSECTNISNITLPDSVTHIGDCAFSYCTSLKKVTLGTKVTTIGDGAFDYCKSLTDITLPDSVTTIGISAFGGCRSLSNINIPQNVTTIGNYAFYGCPISSVIIPDGVTAISEGVFCDCENLQSITIPQSVTSIGDSAFKYCYDLDDVYYNGTQFAWYEISVGSNNSPLNNADIHCFYYVTYKYEDGTVYKKEKVSAGNIITLPENPPRKGDYSFDHWIGYEEYMTATENVTFTAVYKYNPGGTKTTISQNGKKFTVTSNDSEGKTIILALYNGTSLVFFQKKICTGENLIFETDKSYTKAKVMVWDFEKISPVYNCEIVK